MVSMNRWQTFTVVSVLALVAGCAATTETADVTPPEATLGTGALISSTNADGTWTADAKPPTVNLNNKVHASAVFTGPTGKTRKMGVCLLVMTSTACTLPPSNYTIAQKQSFIDSECSGAVPTVPSGGIRYCITENNAGQPYCAYRPGSQAGYCAGSPANGGTPVAPGTYTTPWQLVYPSTSYISDGCFEGCSASDPSSSSATFNNWDCGSSQQFCWKYYPGDPTCGGNCPGT